MSKTNNVTYYARNMQDVLFHLRTVPLLQVYGGCTTVKTLPPASLMLCTIPDFAQIDKHERYIEFGAGVTLSSLLKLGKNNVPTVLYESAETVGTPFLRNSATIVGNLLSSNEWNVKPTLYGPLLSLEVQLELHSPTETTWVPLTKFTGLGIGQFVTKLRVPTDEWEVAVFRRLGSASEVCETNAYYTFLANSQKGTISDVRISFCSQLLVRSRELENMLLGTRLPLTAKDIQAVLAKAMEVYDIQADILLACGTVPPAIHRDQFINLLRDSLRELS